MLFTWEPETSGLTGVPKNLGDADPVRTLVGGPELAFHILSPILIVAVEQPWKDSVENLLPSVVKVWGTGGTNEQACTLRAVLTYRFQEDLSII